MANSVVQIIARVADRTSYQACSWPVGLRLPGLFCGPASGWPPRARVPEDDDPHQPLSVLGLWELMLREDYGQDYAELPPMTNAGAARYLSAPLNTICQDANQDCALLEVVLDQGWCFSAGRGGAPFSGRRAVCRTSVRGHDRH